MLRKLVVTSTCLIGLAHAVAPSVSAGCAQQFAQSDKEVSHRRGESRTTHGYTVWYQSSSGRWTGISHLSYSDACRYRDDFNSRGIPCYIAFDGQLSMIH
jgi:hypothetical protein